MVLQFFTDGLLFQVISRQTDWVSTCMPASLFPDYQLRLFFKISFRPVGGWILLTVKMSLCEMYCSCLGQVTR